MSLFAELHPLFPEMQGIGARTGVILGVLLFPVMEEHIRGSHSGHWKEAGPPETLPPLLFLCPNAANYYLRISDVKIA
jgi:hypothetical protein